MEKTERQLKLLSLLLDADRPVGLEKIRGALYSDQPSEDAAKRMFERDKEDLRSLGVRVEMDLIDAWDEGYVVRRDEATLPDLGLTPAEHAALMLAAQAWGEGMLGGSSPRIAGMKLSAGAAEPPPAPWILPHLDVRSPHLAAIGDAIARRKRIRFKYRATGSVEATDREIEPWGLVFRGAWYVFGRDVAKDERRSFKLERVDGTVKIAGGKDADFEPPPFDAAIVPSTEPERDATLLVDADVAWWAERRRGARRTGEASDGRVELTVPVDNEDQFVRWVLGLADAAEVVAPPDLRSAVAERLARVAEGG